MAINSGASPNGIKEISMDIHVGKYAFMALNTQYIEAVFQKKPVINASVKIFLPFFVSVLRMTLSQPINSGTKPIKRNILLNGIGGQANQRIKALNRAKR
ncbi:hypothetical protein GCM10011418_17970 [Sphingobacterium alkalisoli]|nr:hypothetical protein GCM10011418_17970 [Sphingobacterium alkalisoli]